MTNVMRVQALPSAVHRQHRHRQRHLIRASASARRVPSFWQWAWQTEDPESTAGLCDSVASSNFKERNRTRTSRGAIPNFEAVRRVRRPPSAYSLFRPFLPRVIPKDCCFFFSELMTHISSLWKLEKSNEIRTSPARLTRGSRFASPGA